MTNKGLAKDWLCFIVRRSFIHLLLGAIWGLIWGALCVGAAGFAIGTVIDLVQGPSSMAKMGGNLGLALGGVTGGVICLLGWAVVGLVAPPSRDFVPDSILFRSTMGAMRIATALALGCYFAWSICFGVFSGSGFVSAMMGSLLFALFGVPAMMGIGQIIGIWHGASKLGKPKAPPVQPEVL